jgi:hypothetical protein
MPENSFSSFTKSRQQSDLNLLSINQNKIIAASQQEKLTSLAIDTKVNWL